MYLFILNKMMICFLLRPMKLRNFEDRAWDEPVHLGHFASSKIMLDSDSFRLAHYVQFRT